MRGIFIAAAVAAVLLSSTGCSSQPSPSEQATARSEASAAVNGALKDLQTPDINVFTAVTADSECERSMGIAEQNETAGIESYAFIGPLRGATVPCDTADEYAQAVRDHTGILGDSPTQRDLLGFIQKVCGSFNPGAAETGMCLDADNRGLLN